MRMIVGLLAVTLVVVVIMAPQHPEVVVLGHDRPAGNAGLNVQSGDEPHPGMVNSVKC